MSHTSLADLLGTRGKSTWWERLFLLFAALFISDMVWLVLAPVVVLSSTGQSTLRLFEIPPVWFWVKALLDNLLLAGLALAAFRLLRNTAVALVVVAVGYSPLYQVLNFVLNRVQVAISEEAQITARWDPQALSLVALWVSLFLGGMALALKWVRPVWFALMLGAVAGVLAHRGVRFMFFSFWFAQRERASLETELLYLPFEILAPAVFAIVFWAGLWPNSSLVPMADSSDARHEEGDAMPSPMDVDSVLTYAILSRTGGLAMIVAAAFLARYILDATQRFKAIGIRLPSTGGMIVLILFLVRGGWWLMGLKLNADPARERRINILTNVATIVAILLIVGILI
jgi:hypothetical protein